jgi:carbon monoxide dehydrogenase subunit G
VKVSISTSIKVGAPPETVWSFLCDASMPTAAPWCFKLGVPTPRECTIIGETGGIGAHRQCRTSKGFIDQQITEWIPPSRLTFVAKSDTIGMYKHVRTMQDTFLLEHDGDGTTLTRMTQFETVGFLAVLKGLLFKLTVRQLHRYVMEGFRDLAEKRIL